PIRLLDLAVLEQQPEVSERLAVAAEHQAAGRVLVEPVGELGPAGQAIAQAVEIVLEAPAAPGATMDPPARPPVDDQPPPRARGRASRRGQRRARRAISP